MGEKGGEGQSFPVGGESSQTSRPNGNVKTNLSNQKKAFATELRPFGGGGGEARFA